MKFFAVPVTCLQQKRSNRINTGKLIFFFLIFTHKKIFKFKILILMLGLAKDFQCRRGHKDGKKFGNDKRSHGSETQMTKLAKNKIK